MPRDPTRTIHFVLANALEQRTRRSEKVPAGYDYSDFAAEATDTTDPDARDFYVLTVLYA